MGRRRSATASLGLSSFLLLQSCGDSSPDTFSDGLSSSTLPDDHSSYTAQGYLGQELEAERDLTPGEAGRVWQESTQVTGTAPLGSRRGAPCLRTVARWSRQQGRGGWVSCKLRKPTVLTCGFCCPSALSPCTVTSTLPDWRIPVEIVPDSTSDLYNFQVSPMPSTSEGMCFWGLGGVS